MATHKEHREMNHLLKRAVQSLLSWIFPPRTPATIVRDVQHHFNFLFREYGYSVYACYFDKFDYWNVLLASRAEMLGIWVSSERYITLYLYLPPKKREDFNANAIPIQDVIAMAMNNATLRESCGYESDERGMKKYAQFLKKYYPTLKNFAEQKGWLLEETSLEKAKMEVPLVGRWKYEEPCWVQIKGDWNA